MLTKIQTQERAKRKNNRVKMRGLLTPPGTPPRQYWPGALTIVFPCQTDKVLGLVRGGGQTLGTRMPNHGIPLQLIKPLEVPILGPSANFHHAPTPYKFEDLDKEFLKLVDLVIPGECEVGLVSTVLDCSEEPWKILRQGAIRL